MLIVGLTGGIACGKSTVSNALIQRNIPVVDCDLLAFDAARKGSWGYKRIVSTFGAGILTTDGEVDRVALGRLVFSDVVARRRLNQATHLPVALKLLHQILLYWVCLKQIVVVDMPLLFETGSYKFTSYNVVVACSPDVQLQRLVSRDGSAAADAQARINSQMPLAQKSKLADLVLNNDGSIEQLQQQMEQLTDILSKRSMSLKHLATSPVALVTGAFFLYCCLHLLNG